MVFPDTSFLCGLYVQQSTSARAIALMSGQPTALEVSSLLLYEFRQSVQFQVFRHSRDRTQGYPQSVAQAALAAIQSDVRAGALHLAAVDWADVHQRAEHLCLQYTRSGGHRTVDILHVATALHLGAGEFLTFDANQKKLAEAEGLVVPP
ncbi:MAG: type II toxin-antitoxin system VapC family toxin [Verrucomicrobiaceae bacterium]|nr:type II toxin-antitoxin system VapC family toxin [Verrucomicrobiaceae bacterium]